MAKTEPVAVGAAPAENPDEIPAFYIQATASIQERWPRTLKHGDLFGLFDRLGDIVNPDLTPGGLFLGDTRHLSELKMMLDGQRPLFLSSAIEDDNVVLNVDVSNPDTYREKNLVFPRETLHVRRSRFLWQRRLFERISVHNFDTCDRRCWVSLEFDADFIDLFEIRGLVRPRRGKVVFDKPSDTCLRFRYVGLDKVARTTAVHLERKPTVFRERRADYRLDLAPGCHETLIFTVN